jgi:DNA repair protein RadC
MKSSTTIKDWSTDDQPREKLLCKGTQSLSNAELIAILLGSGNRNESAVDLAKRILGDYDQNLDFVGKLSPDELMKYNGIGEAKAISVVAALELGRRRISTQQNIVSIGHSEDIFKLMQGILLDLVHEEFWVLYLNRANKIIRKFKLSQGGISGTVIDVRLVLKAALENNASSIILCHNHPSGNTSPSEADKKITHKLKEAASLLDIQVLDHIIIGENKYFSFADNGLMHSV